MQATTAMFIHVHSVSIALRLYSVLVLVVLSEFVRVLPLQRNISCLTKWLRSSVQGLICGLNLFASQFLLKNRKLETAS
jgi:hypothetical protein